MPAIKGNPLSPTLGSLGDRWGYVMWSVMLNIYIFMTSEDERTKNEYDYFYDEIVKDDLLKRQKNFSTHSGPFVWTVAWSRENERFEYVAENGRTFGFGIDDPPRHQRISIASCSYAPPLDGPRAISQTQLWSLMVYR